MKLRSVVLTGVMGGMRGVCRIGQSVLMLALVGLCAMPSRAHAKNPYFICPWCENKVLTKDATFVGILTRDDQAVTIYYKNLATTIPSSSHFYQYKCPHCNMVNILSDEQVYKDQKDQAEKQHLSTGGMEPCVYYGATALGILSVVWLVVMIVGS